MILVTGSSGFVGRALLRRLGGRALPCDLRIGRPIESVVHSREFQSVETVVHCAAVQLFSRGYDLYDYESFRSVNVGALELLLRRSAEIGVRKFIHVSSDMVYGIPPPEPVPEESPLRPVGFYGCSKRLAEERVLRYAAAIPVVTILRPRVIGGAGRGGLFLVLAKACRRGLPVPVFGSGDNPFQLVHVEDFVDLILEAVERDVPGIFNAGSLEVSTMREKIETMARALGRRARIWRVPESRAIAVCELLYRLKFGPLHPEQYLTAGRPFVLSLRKTFAHFAWRPSRSDDEVIREMAMVWR